MLLKTALLLLVPPILGTTLVHAQVPPEVDTLQWCTAATNCLQWTATSSATTYRVYGGTTSGFPTLLNGQVDSCLIGEFSITTTGALTGPAPSPAGLSWYLVSAVNGSGEGSAGGATAGPRIVNTSGPCLIPCDSFDDCPANQACNLSGGFCDVACGAGHSSCNGGCCNGTQCVSGDSNAACGGTGGGCVDCAQNEFNTRCVFPQQRCGCFSQTDCRAANPATGSPGQACDLSVRSCTSTCGVDFITTDCNGGCCSGNVGTQGWCRVGTSSDACGANGHFCNSCVFNCNSGTICLPGGTCGCTIAGGCDFCGNRHCAVDTSICCVGTGGTCSSPAQCCSGICSGMACACIPAGSSCQQNPALCCSGTCIDGVCS